jgi:hypothetical protein
MSDIEYECWYSIWAAYARWAVQQHIRPMNWLAYGRALGLQVP